MERSKFSIFDNQEENPSLWLKTRQDIDSPVRLGSYAYKRSIKNEEFDERFFYIQKHYLLYKRTEDSSKPSACLDLKWTRAEFNQITQIDGKAVYEVSLIRNKKISCVYFKERNLFLKWIKVLKSICVLTDFGIRYKMEDYLGEGKFGKVSLFLYFYVFL